MRPSGKVKGCSLVEALLGPNSWQNLPLVVNNVHTWVLDAMEGLV